MADFQSAQERRKWQSLQNSAGSSFQAIVQGRANAGDYQRVSSILSGLNTLAREVFDRAVSSAETQGKKLAAQIDHLDAVRSDEAVQRSINAAMAQSLPDVLAQIKDIFTLELLEHNEDLSNTIKTGFTDIKQYLPQTQAEPATADDVLSAAELVIEQVDKDAGSRWERQEQSLLAKMSQVFKTAIMEVAAAMRARSAPARGPMGPRSIGYSGGSVGRQNYGSGPAPGAGPPTVLMNAQRLLGVGGASSAAAPMLGSQGAGASSSPTTGTAPVGSSFSPSSGVAVNISQAAEDQIRESAKAQTALFDQIRKLLDGSQQDSGGNADDEEQKKADTWWRSFKNWMGDKFSGDKKKGKGTNWGAWVKGLGLTLLTMVTNPQLYETIGNIISKYFTWENVKSAALASWEYLKDKGKAAVDWVMEKLGLKKSDSTTGGKDDDKPGLLSSAWSWAKDKLGIGGDKSSTTGGGGSTAGTVGSAPAMIGGSGVGYGVAAPAGMGGIGVGMGTGDASSYIGGSSNTKNNIAFTANGPTSNATTSSAGSTTSISNKTTINAASGPSGSNTTESVPASPVSSMSDGVMLPVGSSSGETTPADKDSRSIRGTPQLGISSFNFTPAMDDQLIMMNSSFFSGA